MIRFCVLFALASLGAEPVVRSVEPLADLDEKFTRADGWNGADAAYSIPISPTRTAWFFGDTWIGAVKNNKRSGSKMVNNTVGIQDGAKFTFPIRRDKSDKALSHFAPEDGKGFLWPLGGTFHGGKLYLFLAQVEHTKEPGAFGFKQIAQWLGVVSNPNDNPLDWKLTRQKVPFCEFSEKRTITFGSAVLQADGFAYIYGIDQSATASLGGKYTVLARAPLDKLADFAAWEFRRESKWLPWVEGFPGRDHLLGGAASECSVTYLPAFKKYVMVNTDFGLSDRIVAHYADAPEGPFSGVKVLYTCPEMKGDKQLFTYAAKAHPHLGGENELVVSYCVNAHDWSRVINDAGLYRPRFVKVTLR